MKRNLVLFFVALVTAPVVANAEDHSQAIDRQMENKFESLIDIPTGNLKEMSLEQLKEMVKAIAPFHEIGALREKGKTELHYQFDAPQKDGSTLGFEILTIAKLNEKKIIEHIPLNIRLTFRSPSGVFYCNSLLYNPWISEMRTGEKDP